MCLLKNIIYRNIPEEGDWSKFWAEEDRFVLEGLSPDNENHKSNLKWFTETHSGIYNLSTLDEKTDLPKFAS